MDHIYLDYNASTPIDPEVLEAMKAFFTARFGNPSSSHWAGIPAKAAVEQARNLVAGLLGCGPEEVIFTSGGSESNNHALKGVFYALREQGNHIITTQIEHPAIINPCKFLEGIGAQVTYVGVDRYGQVSPADIENAITDKTVLISVMHANNEVGTIQPIAEISRIAKKHRIVFHTDAAQSVGKIPTNVEELGIDLLTVAGHKLYATKGIGALYIRKGTPIEPLIHGAGHENERRAGTENVPNIVGLGKACEIALQYIDNPKILDYRDCFWNELKQIFKDRIVLNGHPVQRLPNTLNVSFIGKNGNDLMQRIPEIAASTGSACHSGMITLSPVLRAMGVDEQTGMGAIRFSLGRNTTKDEIDRALELIKERIK
ncbi:cysteine desulfurase family protein [Paenibacillus filicis]|uniref:cysteine desulfurase n=1 Tax=Paenibacillus gyeongsangnamensis TaxID=3388067 RepID=A0ABT4QJC7_9BACL|nr:cysteine desulfurase family protein [Paenibacillus filicis]MCZ8516977.1 cysteine desulfurase family protein [Paenibacillus filicis]